jgi:hypothetical protein
VAGGGTADAVAAVADAAGVVVVEAGPPQPTIIEVLTNSTIRTTSNFFTFQLLINLFLILGY